MFKGAISTIVALSIASTAFYWNQNKGLKGDLLNLETEVTNLTLQLNFEVEKNKIRVSNSILQNAAKLTFAEVSNEFNYLYDKKLGELLKHERVTTLYEWKYTFSFGVDIKEGWDWCPKVDEVNGVVKVQAPKIEQTNVNPVAPMITKVVNNAYWDEHLEIANKIVFDKATDVVDERGKSYLTQKSIIDMVELSLSSHLKNVMNAAHKASNPISKVEVIFVEESSCSG